MKRGLVLFFLLSIPLCAQPKLKVFMNSRNFAYSNPVGPSWSPVTAPATPSMSAGMTRVDPLHHPVGPRPGAHDRDVFGELLDHQILPVPVRVARRGEWKPYRLRTPVELEVRFKNYRPSEVLAYLSIVERTDSHSVRFRGRDILEVSRFLSILNYEPALAP